VLYGEWHPRRVGPGDDPKALLRQIIPALAEYERLVGQHGSVSSRVCFRLDSASFKLGLPCEGLLRDDKHALAVLLLSLALGRPEADYFSGASLNHSMVQRDIERVREQGLGEALARLLQGRAWEDVYETVDDRPGSPRRAVAGKNRSRSPAPKISVTTAKRRASQCSSTLPLSVVRTEPSPPSHEPEQSRITIKPYRSPPIIPQPL
jgi:hypothetical protein